MMAELRSDIMMNAPVKAISEQAGDVEVMLANGKRLRAKQVVCTIPFSVLRGISIDANLPEALRSTIQRLPYTKASFAFLHASTSFWKGDGLPETIWTDDPLIGRVFALDGDPPLLKVWLNGPRAEALDRMEPATAGKEMIRRIERIRPSAQGKLEYLDMFSWQKQPFAGGIYHHIGTGLGASLAATVQHRGRRLHFAGEHMARLASGMEGALESGERAALMVLEKL
jgi:monoamine oxidase